ncbi:DUF2000 family protein [Streptomyces indonesiensis]
MCSSSTCPGRPRPHGSTTSTSTAWLGTKTEDLDYLAVSLVGPRNKVSRLIGKLPLLR